MDSLEIAQQAKPLPIIEIAKKLGLEEGELELHGKYKAKILPSAIERRRGNKDGKLILATAITPTMAGEGKTTTSIGLVQAFAKKGKKVMASLRQPSMGPVFGIKGGATGGGYSQLLPMEDINIHFTGDIHAITAAHNLLSSLVDNYIYYNKEKVGNATITWPRALDVNDRSLRELRICVDGNMCVPRPDHFVITAASEIMAILCLANGLPDLKERLGNILVGYDGEGKPIFARDVKAVGAMAAVLRNAIMPNLVQTLEGVPAFVHGGPFANIAHGCSTIISTKFARKLADIVVTEAGFGSDLGMEKFCNIKCGYAGIAPDAVVLVATVRALRCHGKAKDFSKPNLEAVKKGIPNLGRHMENIGHFKIPYIVAINLFPDDSEEEIGFIKEYCKEKGIEAVESAIFAKGGEGGLEMADAVEKALEKKGEFCPLYGEGSTIKEKVEAIAGKIYGAKGVEFSAQAEKSIELAEKNGFGKLPVCVSKTQMSITDAPEKGGVPEGDYTIEIRDVYVSSGAGFVVALSGNLITMPGLNSRPNAHNIDVDNSGKITGLF